jgi:membrane-bound metal-dependent hydrolase YbcI (DUF457 family)
MIVRVVNCYTASFIGVKLTINELEPLLHFSVPFAVLVYAGYRPRRALPLALLGVLPDLDAVLLIHRSMTHSLVVVTVLSAPVFIYAYLKKPSYSPEIVVGFLVLASHSIFDVFMGLTPVLWPLLSQSIWLKLRMNFMYSSGFSLAPEVKLFSSTTNFTPMTGFDYPLFTGEGIILTLALMLPILLREIYQRDL